MPILILINQKNCRFVARLHNEAGSPSARGSSSWHSLSDKGNAQVTTQCSQQTDHTQLATQWQFEQQITLLYRVHVAYSTVRLITMSTITRAGCVLITVNDKHTRLKATNTKINQIY